VGEVVQSSIMMADLIVPTDKSLDFSFFKGDVDTGKEMSIRGGEGKMRESVTDFDTVKLDDNSIYNFGIDLDDVISSLKGVAGISELLGKAHIAADVNSDGMLNLDDIIGQLKGVAGISELKEFSVVDDNNMVINNIDILNTSATAWSLVAKGDVDMSGGFLDMV
jgi:hypothetical protein